MLRINLKKNETFKIEFSNKLVQQQAQKMIYIYSYLRFFRLDYLFNGCRGLQETLKKMQQQIIACRIFLFPLFCCLFYF